MKRTILILVILCVSYFVFGFIGVKFNWISQDAYNTYATVVGGLASVYGLIAFILPRLTVEDIQSIEMAFLKRVTKAIEELEKYENKRSQKEEELARLNIQKEEMELLVRKASFQLFLEDQIERNQKRIIDFINSHKEMHDILLELKDQKGKLKTLKAEIAIDPNVELLEEIMKMVRTDTSSYAMLEPSVARATLEVIRKLF